MRLRDLEILALHAQAELTFGEKLYSWDFHDRVLGNGANSLAKLRANIEHWIKRNGRIVIELSLANTSSTSLALNLVFWTSFSFKGTTLYVSKVFLICCGAHAAPLQLLSIQVESIKDTATGRDYELYVKVPKDYDPKSEKRYPVIYIADALWHIEIVSGSIEYLVKDAVLVGVSWEKGLPPQQSRMRDYMPSEYTGKDYPHPTGKADQHLAFLRNTVFKQVESKYKIDSSQRTYFGYSASGTFGSFILLTKPNTFKNYILGSPATLFGNIYVYEYEPILKMIPESITAIVFVAVGSDEEQSSIQHALGLVHFLKSKKTDESRVTLRVIESADHGRAFPSTAMQSLYWLADIYD